SLVLFLVLWLKLVKDFLKVRCRLALLPFLISCLIWLDLVASLPLIKERILVIILLLHFLSLDRKNGSAGMPRPISYAVFCLKKKNIVLFDRRKFEALGRTLFLFVLSCDSEREGHRLLITDTLYIAAFAFNFCLVRRNDRFFVR